MRRGNEIVNLTRTEWNLLQCLASNADKLMMNAELLGKVWGPEYVSDLQYLRVWISRLRTKIGHNSSGHSIVRTFPGIGYMLSTQPEVAAGEEAPTAVVDDAEDDDADLDALDAGADADAGSYEARHAQGA